MHNKRNTCLLVDKRTLVCFERIYLEQFDVYEGVNQDFFVHNDALKTCDFTTLLGQDPMKCKTLGNGVCS